VVIFCCFDTTLSALGTFVATDGDDIAVFDLDRIAAAVVVLVFTVLGIPHMRASVVLTTLRLGLPGVHIIALT
jgi:energy-converting hydrogenase Eha subunit B